MELTDLASLDEWKALENAIFEKYGLETNVFNIDGIRITDNKRWVNSLCPEIKATDKGQSFICAVAHMNLALMAKAQNEPVIEECDGGLVKIVVPIIKDDHFVGAFGACGFILDDGEVDTFMINKTTEIDEARIESLSGDIKTITSDDAGELAREVTEKIAEILA